MNQDFVRWLVEPLTTAVEQHIIKVSVMALRLDLGSQAAIEPEAVGYSCVEFEMEDLILEVTWGSISQLRPNNAYHIQTYCRPMVAPSFLKYEDDIFLKIDKSSEPPWNNVIGKTIDNITVLGKIDSPQAIEMSIAGAAIILAIGWCGSHLDIGDGDEIIVLTKRSWDHFASDLDKNLLWQWHRLESSNPG